MILFKDLAFEHKSSLNFGPRDGPNSFDREKNTAQKIGSKFVVMLKSLILTRNRSRKSEINVSNKQIKMTLCGPSARI